MPMSANEGLHGVADYVKFVVLKLFVFTTYIVSHIYDVGSSFQEFLQPLSKTFLFPVCHLPDLLHLLQSLACTSVQAWRPCTSGRPRRLYCISQLANAYSCQCNFGTKWTRHHGQDFWLCKYLYQSGFASFLSCVILKKGLQNIWQKWCFGHPRDHCRRRRNAKQWQSFQKVCTGQVQLANFWGFQWRSNDHVTGITTSWDRTPRQGCYSGRDPSWMDFNRLRLLQE